MNETILHRKGAGHATARHLAFVLLPMLALLLSVPQALAQGAVVPRIEEAEQAFDQGVQAFEEGDYGMAFRRFRLVYEQQPPNLRTTAAVLMAGKALYRDGAYAEAADHLSRFLRDYPSSLYAEEARRTLDFARQQMTEGERLARVRNLGIVLPLTGDETLTQALFNGIRLAVDEYNAVAGEQGGIRMVFRDTEQQAGRAQAAVAELANDKNVDFIIGPLYSDEAQAAAVAAEAAGVVLVAPLATDEVVSEGRRYVFQANPTITMRGRLMARYAIENLRLNRLGVAAELNDSYSERMAEGFQDEALLLGADLVFYDLVPRASDWGRLGEVVGEEALRQAEAIYLPVSGGQAERLIRAALNSLDRANTGVRVLGNKEWHDLAVKTQASKYLSTYTNDFYVNPANPAVEAFNRRYEALTGSTPGQQEQRLAYTGYDVARFLLLQFVNRSDQPLADALRQAPPYQGLGMRIDFRDSNVNEATYIFRYRAGNMELVR